MSKSQLARLAVQVPEIAELRDEVVRLSDENALLRAALDEIRTFPRLRMPADIANAVLGPKVKK